MAQHVRRDARRIEPGRERHLLQQQREALAGERGAVAAGEQQARGFVRPSTRPAAASRGGIRQRHDTLLAALAAHQQQRGVAGQRGERQGQQLGDAQAGGVEDFQRGARSGRPARAACGRRRSSSASTSARSGTSAAPGQPGRIEQRGGIVGAHALAQQEPMELPQRRQPAGGGAGRQARRAPGRPYRPAATRRPPPAGAGRARREGGDPPGPLRRPASVLRAAPRSASQHLQERLDMAVQRYWPQCCGTGRWAALSRPAGCGLAGECPRARPSRPAGTRAASEQNTGTMRIMHDDVAPILRCAAKLGAGIMPWPSGLSAVCASVRRHDTQHRP